MKKLVIDKSLIPEGLYCDGCPYYHWRPIVYPNEPGCPSMTARGIAFCDVLQTDDNGLYKQGHRWCLLWDGCKECSINYGSLEAVVLRDP